MIKAELINYFDVWGNEKDGWEVNNQCSEGEIELPSWGNADVLKALKQKGFLLPHVRRNMLYFDQSFSDAVEIRHKRTNAPICMLRETLNAGS